MVYPRVAAVLVALATSLHAPAAGAQGFIGLGLSTGSIPRALSPLCGSARRLNGVGLSGAAGFTAGPLRVGGALDYIGRWGTTEIASCVPRMGLSVDSSFAPAGNSAATASLFAWLPVVGVLRVGGEAGAVISHSSWFVGPVVGAHLDNLGIELSARRYGARFDEVTRNFGSGTTVELSRSRRTEPSWGLLARVMFYKSSR